MQHGATNTNSIADLLAWAVCCFRASGLPSARLDAELLLAGVFNSSREDLYTKPVHFVASAKHVGAFRVWVKERARGVPVAYILQSKNFYKNAFFVQRGVFVPRPETELLVELGLEYLNTTSLRGLVIDMGCGTGCVGLSLKHAVPEWDVCLIDSSQQAVSVAKKNAQKLGLKNGVRFLCNRVEDCVIKQRCVLVVANPPYVAKQEGALCPWVKAHEPAGALFALDAGLGAIKAWAIKAAEFLVPDGRMLCEIGAGQAEVLRDWFLVQRGLRLLRVEKDLSYKDRVLVLQKT